MSISSEQLKNIIEKIERLEEEKATISTDIREVYAEAKSVGYDTKTIRQIIKIRKMDQDDFQEQEALLDTYMNALKMRVGNGDDSN
ncbi:MAG: hypothetical protein CMM87_04505 [Rickettsiales bacterium]|nr:hypothetical protein [Rickettsiales bacterium]|tara:strand:- start:14304 stop:14561 length:258 start_codon:yes stop_codon:yes gene_type:complete